MAQGDDLKQIIMKAILCDSEKRSLEAQDLYSEAVNQIMALVQESTDTARKKATYERVKEYIERIEKIDERISLQNQTGERIAYTSIADDAVGFTYDSLFGQYLNETTREILLEEPYLLEKYQFQNLMKFIELCVKNCSNFRYLRLITKRDKHDSQKQYNILEQIKVDLQTRNILLKIKFEDTLHDRRIMLSNGYCIKIGRGLHFYKAANSLWCVGVYDFHFRKCHQTDVEICHTSGF